MVRLCQCICISFDLCIKSTQVLSGGVVYINVILGTGWLVIVIERLACYQLVGSRCIRSLVGCTCSERTCTKSLAPGVFAGFPRCFSLCFYSITITRVFNGIVVFIKLYVSIFIRLIDFDLTAHTRSILQLFHDNSIMVFNPICCFDEAIVIRRCIGGFLFH